MPDLVIASRGCSAKSICAPQYLDQFLAANPSLNQGYVVPGTPYWAPTAGMPLTTAPSLGPLVALAPQQRVLLSQAANQFGDLTVPLARFYQQALEPLPAETWQFLADNKRALADAAVGATAGQYDKFVAALTNYKNSLEALRAANQQRLPRSQLVQLEQVVRNNWQRLNSQFRVQLQRLLGEVSARRGTPLSNPQRAINIARSSRNAAALAIETTSEVRAISRFATGLKGAGTGFVILDAGVRANTVYNDYQAGKDWQRSAVVETTSMGFSVATAAVTTDAVIAAGIAIGLCATPVGWVVAIGLGAVAAYFSASAVNGVTANLAGQLYDKSSNWW